MKLSKLLYLSIKDVVYNNDSSFTYENFMEGSFDNDIELSLQINNCFSPLNAAISRLLDLDRIPYRYEKINGVSADLTEFAYPVKEIVGVHNGKEAVGFKQFGNEIVLLWSTKAFVEYKEDIKQFSKEDLVPLEYEEDGSYQDKNIELKDYGIAESMASYICEYVKGKLLEPIAPEMANLHISTAENYFMNIMPNRKNSLQSAVQHKYNIGD